MALVRRTLDHVRRVKPRIDRAKVDSTTEAQIRRQMVEDGQNPAGELTGFVPVIPPQVLRKHLGMTQAELSRLENGLLPNGVTSTTGWSLLLGPHVTSIIGLSTSGALINTLVFAGIASVVAVLLGIVTGFGIRRPGKSRGWLGAFAFAPVVLSPVVLSFALATSYRPLFGGESTVWVLILLSQATLALPFALQSLFVPLRQLPHTPREAAETLGARPVSAYLDTELWMERISGAEGGELQSAIAASLEKDTEPYLLQYIISELNEPMEDGAGLNDEEKGEVFFVLKTVISTLTAEPRRRIIEIE